MTRRSLLLLLVIAAAGLRVPAAVSCGLDDDEFYTLENAVRLLWSPSPEPVRSFPLTFAFARASIELFGLNPAALRVFSLACGLLAVLALGRAARTIGGERAGLLCGLLLAVWPWHQYFSGVARYYAPLFLFSALALGYMWRFLDRACPRAGGKAALAVLAATAVHPVGVLSASGAAAVLWHEKARDRIPKKVWLVFSLAGAAAVALVAFTPYGAPLRTVLSGAAGRGGGLARLVFSLLNNLGLSIVALGLVGALALTRERPAALGFLVMAACVPVVVPGLFAVSDLAQARYAMAGMPAVLCLAAIGLDRLVQGVRSRFARACVVAAAVAPLVPSLASNLSDGDRHDWGGAASILRRELEPGDLLIAEQHGLVRTELYGYGRAYPPGRGDPPYPDAFLEAPPERETLDAILEHRATAWFLVPSGRLDADPAYRDLRSWLRAHARIEARIGRQRLDYHRNELLLLRTRWGGAG